MVGYLTTHVLDTALGRPAEGLEVKLFKIDGDKNRHLKTLITNKDGRTGEKILPEEVFEIGLYELIFYAGHYFNKSNFPLETPRFLDIIPIRFGMSEPLHYHVPLLLSPFGYSTYRGS
jgi:5-hydroxyisourate hydrolase